MRTRSFLLGVLVFIPLLVGHGAQANEAARALAAIEADVERGARVFRSTGGCTCHTNYPGEGQNAPELAGGSAMETPFGVFYSTNITPDRATGVGEWSNADFARAMREGLSQKGQHYFRTFPYPSFSGLTD